MIGLISTVVLVSLIVVLVVPLIVVGVSELEFVVIVIIAIIVAASIAESMKIEGATLAAALVDAKDGKHSSKLHQ